MSDTSKVLILCTAPFPMPCDPGPVTRRETHENFSDFYENLTHSIKRRGEHDALVRITKQLRFNFFGKTKKTNKKERKRARTKTGKAS